MRVPHQFATCAANKNKTKQTKQIHNKQEDDRYMQSKLGQRPEARK